MDMPSSDTKHSQQAVNAKNCGNLAIPQKKPAIPRHQPVVGPFYGWLVPFKMLEQVQKPLIIMHQPSFRYNKKKLTKIKQV